MTSPNALLAIRLQYFFYFGVLGIYLPFFNLYCYHLGFSGVQIGALSAARSLVMVVCSVIWGHLADRFRMRRTLYILCSIFSAVTWMLFLTTVEFWQMLSFTILYVIFYAPIISFLEAFTMDLLAYRKEAYGRVRAWGSISFILVVIVLGRVIDFFPIRLILVLILVGSLLQAAASALMPRREPDIQPQDAAPADGRLRSRRVVLFLFCGFLMLVSHGAYYGFFSIHLENLGYSRAFIGLCWAMASLAEILVMIRSEAVFKRFPPEKILLLSFGAAVLRWSVLYVLRSPGLILASQTLHAFTYGTFHMASILYIDRLTPEKAKTVGQAVNNAVQYGLGLMTGFFLNGFLYEHVGSPALFLISAGIAICGGAIFWRETTSHRRQRC